MHHGRIVFARENVAGAAHVGCQLIDLFDTAYRLLYEGRIAQVAAQEFVRRGFLELVALQVGRAYPMPLRLQPPDEDVRR